MILHQEEVTDLVCFADGGNLCLACSSIDDDPGVTIDQGCQGYPEPHYYEEERIAVRLCVVVGAQHELGVECVSTPSCQVR